MNLVLKYCLAFQYLDIVRGNRILSCVVSGFPNEANEFKIFIKTGARMKEGTKFAVRLQFSFKTFHFAIEIMIQ